MKHLLIMVIVAVVVGPVVTSRDPNPRRGVRRMLWFLLAFNVAYVAWVTLVHASHFVPHR